MNIVNYVYIVTLKHLQEAMNLYPDAADELSAWSDIVARVRWHSFHEVREFFADADAVDGYVVFNIRRNRYGLITVVHYAKTGAGRHTSGHLYIRSFLTHKQYDKRSNWDRRFGTV